MCCDQFTLKKFRKFSFGALGVESPHGGAIWKSDSKVPRRRTKMPWGVVDDTVPCGMALGGALTRKVKVDLRRKNHESRTWKETWIMKLRTRSQKNKGDLTCPWASGPAKLSDTIHLYIYTCYIIVIGGCLFLMFSSQWNDCIYQQPYRRSAWWAWSNTICWTGAWLRL